ncbi:MAG: sulfite oxidase [Verrucomicrobia bacterium]|nr:sulfite oxidase [Verrucomicrobiota bacterium]
MRHSGPHPRQGRSTHHHRRGFLKRVVAGALSVPFLNHLPAGVRLLAQDAGATATIPGKQGLRILSDRPLNAETPATLLDDPLTPNHRHFVRNNGRLPERARTKALNGWSLRVDGEVDRPLTLTLDDLRRFPRHEAALVIECGGNGRAGFFPPASGNQWTLGAVGCALYEGTRLRDVLNAAGIKPSAVYIGYYGEDPHLSGDPKKESISRGFPIEKALDPHTMLAWSMNGEALPDHHGFPLRLVCPGWPGSASGKWLNRIWVRDREHDGSKMTGSSYRIPKHPVAPGTEVADADMAIIKEMPVKSIITRPASGIDHSIGVPIEVRGHAWSGFGDITAMHVSHDFGATWAPAKLNPPRNKYAWQQWEASLRFPVAGYYEVWARATDAQGQMQPMIVPGWNPKGYLNNAMHRIAVKIS